MAKSKKLPREFLVYVGDRLDDGTPVYYATANVDGIPEDADGEKVGNYVLKNEATFRVRRELK